VPGEAEEAQALRAAQKNPGAQAREMREANRASRPEWRRIVVEAERILGTGLGGDGGGIRGPGP